MLDYGSAENNLSLLPYLTGSNQADFFIQHDPGMSYRVLYVLNKARFSTPVRAGGRLRARTELQSAEAVGDAIEIIYLLTIEMDGESKPACVAEQIFRGFP